MGLHQRLHFALLEERVLLAAQPVVTVDGNLTPLIGEQAQLTVTFDNVPDASPGSNVGYAPYVDLIVPQNGADGGGPGSTPPNQNDGASFVSATYLGTTLDSTVIEFDANGQATHPFARDATGALRVVNAADYGAAPGDQLVVLRLPYGSFVPEQPAAQIQVTLDVSDLADLDTPLPFTAVGGFAFGRDAQNNPTVDPPVLGTPVTVELTPRLFTIEKAFNGPEGETATGPNFERSYTITFDIAEGQRVTNTSILDTLPDGIVIVGDPVLSVPGSAVYDPVTHTILATIDGTITGVAGPEATVTFNFYVDRTLTPGDPGTPVLDPIGGGPRTLENNVSAQTDWQPIDDRDDPITITFDPAGPEEVFIARSIATQKGQEIVVDANAAGLGPGDTLEYAIDIQVSDYFDMQDLVLRDVMSDGQAYIAGSARIEVVEGGSALGSGAFTGGNIQVVRDATTGRTSFVFNLSDQLVANGAPDGVLQGGEGGLGATTLRVVYQATVERFFLAGDPANPIAVGQGDTLSNTATIEAAVVDGNGDPTGGTPTDGTSSSGTIATGGVAKSVYALNGVDPGTGPLRIVAGDLITFRLTYDLPQTLTAELRLTDYLPLPVFDVDNFTLTLVDEVSAAVPGLNQAKFGPEAGTFRALLTETPQVLRDSAQNSLTFVFRNLEPDTPVASTADILFTIRVADRPFGDGLLLTNQVSATEISTTGTTTTSDAITQVTLTEPVLQITKGIVATDSTAGIVAPLPVGPVAFTAPGSAGVRFSGTIESANLRLAPVDSDLSDVDAGDRVTFALVVENIGRGRNGAFDVRIDDSLPQGYRIPASGLNLQVTNGAGTALAFVGDLFTTGITLIDPPGGGSGALARFADSGGANVLVITYDLELTETVQPRSQVTNLAAIDNYAAIEGGIDRVPSTTVPTEDVATTRIGDPDFVKTIVGTSVGETGAAQGNPGFPDLTIGEQVTFELVATLREGRIVGFEIADRLPTSPGQLRFVNAEVVSIGANLFVRDPGAPGGVGAALSDPVITEANGVVRFRFADDIVNLPDNVVNDDDRIVLRVTAVAANVPGNVRGTELVNVGELSFTVANQAVTLTDTATAEVVGPAFAPNKVADREFVQGNDIVTYTIELTPLDGGFLGPAFDVLITDDLLPGSLTLIANSGVLRASPAGGATITSTGGVVTVTAPVLLPGETIRFTYQARVEPTVQAGTTLPNTADFRGDSHPGVPPTGIADQREFRTTASDSVRVPGPGIVKTVSAADTSLSETGSNLFDPTRPDLAIGEIVTYRIVVTLPEAVTTDVVLTDFLPGAIAQPPGSSGLFEFLSAAIVRVGSQISGIGIPRPDGTPSDTSGDGILDTVVFRLGQLTNRPDGVTDTGDEIEFTVTARVRDAAENLAARAPVNLAEVAFGTGFVARATAAVDIVEPAVRVDKSSDVASGDAGDRITYTVRLPIGGTSGPAFDVVTTDTVPVGINVDVSTLAFVGAAPAGSTLAYDPTTRTITARVPAYLSTDPTIVFTYQGVVDNSVRPAEVLVNTARLVFDSHPGNPGDAFQRDYGPFLDTARFTVDLPSLSKRVIDTDIPETGFLQLRPQLQDVAVGETVTYLLTLRLPEATTNLVLTDFLPRAPGSPPVAGDMEWIASRIVSIGGNIELTAPPDPLNPPAPGDVGDVQSRFNDGFLDTVVWNFGLVTNRADNVEDADDLIVFEVVARVPNLATNQPADTLINLAQAQYSRADGTTALITQTETIEIVGPALNVDKAASPSGGDAGDVVTYTVTITHEQLSTSTAFGLVLTDLLAPDLQLIAGSVVPSLPGATVVRGNNAGDTTVEVTLDRLLRPSDPALPAQSLVITYQARLADAVRPGETIPNTAELDWQSAPVGFPEARPDTDSDGAEVTVNITNAIEKVVVATSLPETGSGFFDPTLPDLAVGETVTYEIRVTLGEGTQRVLVEDVLPAGLAFVSGSVVSIGANITDTAILVGAVPVVANGRLTFDFGAAVTNTGDNQGTGADVIVMRVIARVLPGVSDAGDVLTNNATLTNDLRTQSDTAPVEVVKPDVVISKDASVPTGDAGDVITFTVVIAQQAGASAPLYDLRAEDILPAGYVLVAGSASASRGTVTESGNIIRVTLDGAALLPTDNPLTAADETRITLIYRAVLADAVQPGQVLTNSIGFTGSSAPGGGATTETSTGSDTATVTVVMPVALEKTIVATSNGETGSGGFDPAIVDLAQGETVTYRIVATLSEGTQTLVVNDTLPAGLVLVSARVTGVGAGLPPGLAAIANTGTGQGILFDFGTVVNRGNNVAGDGTVTIEVVARLQDATPIAPGTVLTNQAQVEITSPDDPDRPGGTQTDNDNVPVEVVAPALTIDKVVDLTSGDAGDVFTYTVTIDHTTASSAAAFDVVIEDVLDPVFRPVSVSSTAGTATITGNTITLSLPVFRLTDAPVVVTYVVAFRDTIEPGQVVGNTATLDYDSNPGPGGLPGTGEASAEDVTGVFALDLTKTIVATSLPGTGNSQFDPDNPDLAIGETVTYQLVATLSEGTQTLLIRDTLPAGLGLVSAAVTAVGAGLPAGLLNVVNSGTGQGIVFDFGTVVNTGNNVLGDGTVTITVVARALDVAGNQAGIVLTNAANAEVTAPTNPQAPGGTLTDNDSASVDIVAPDVVITKSTTFTTGDAGDEVTFTLVVSQRPGASGPLYDLVVTDPIPAGMALVAGSVTTSRGTVVAAGGALRVEVAGEALAASDDPLTAADEATITITYRVRLTDAVQPGQVITNTAAFTGLSAPEPGAGGEGRVFTGDDDATVTVAMPVALEKTIVATSLPESGTDQGDPAIPDVAVGERITYNLVATLAEGTQTLVISDSLPPGLEVLSARLVGTGAGVTAGAPAITIAGQAVTFDFGTVVNTGNNITTDGTVTVEIIARVRDVPGNVTGTQLTNAGTVTVTAPDDPDRPGGTETATDDTTAEVVEPELVIDKAAPPAFLRPGETITYTVTLSHAAGSTAAAYDIVLADLLDDPFLDLVAGSVSTSAGTVTLGNGAGDATVRIDLPVLALGQVLTVTFTALVAADAPGGLTIANTVTADFDSAGGEGGRPDDVTDGTTTPGVPALVKQIVATSNPDTGSDQFDPTVPDLSVGETLTYRLTITLPQGTIENVVLSDLLPGALAPLGARVVSVGAGLTAGAPAITIDGQAIRFAFGTVVNGSTAAIGVEDTIVVEIDARVIDLAGVNAGAPLVNAAQAGFTIGGRPGTLDVTAPAELVEPELVIAKRVDRTTGDAGDTFTYTVTIDHAADSTAAAYDVVVEDVLDARFAPLSVSASVGTATITGNTIRLEIPRLLLDDAPVTLTYVVAFRDTIEPGQVVRNTASLDFDSNPGEGGRPGEGTASAQDVVAVFGLNLTKTIVETSLPETGSDRFDPNAPDLAIGETATYELVATLSEGTQRLVITDLFPEGLLPLPGQAFVVSTGAGISAGPGGTLTPTAVFDGQRVTFDFGTIVNTGDNLSNGGDQVTIRIVARAIDLPINTNGRQVENDAEATISSPTDPTAPGGTVTDNASAVADIVVPRYLLDKAVDRPAGDAGDVFTYTLTLTPAAGTDAPAFNILVEDPLSPFLSVIAGSLTSTVGTATLLGNTIRIEIPVLLPDAAPVVITYRAAFTDAIEPGQVVPNLATLDYGTAPNNQRDLGDDAEASVRGAFTVALDKQVVATSLPETGSAFFDPARPDIAAGETVTYRLTATLSEGTQRLVITDTLPSGLIAESARLVSLGAGIAAGAPTITIQAGRVVFDFGTVVNTGDNVGADTVVLEVVARLNAGPDAGTPLDNTAQADVSSPTDPGAPGGSLSATDTAGVEAVAAVLVFDKQATPATVGLGEAITYTITLSHAANSTAPAYEVVLFDPLSEASLRLVPGSVVASGGTVVTGNGGGDTGVRVTLPVLLPGQVLTVTFQARAVGIPIPDGVAPNTATFDSTSAPGDIPPGFTRPAFGQDSASVQIASGSPPEGGSLLADFDDDFRRIAQNRLSVPAILTGMAQPGSAVSLALRDANGAPITLVGVTADVGGHWVASPVAATAGAAPDTAALDGAFALAGRQSGGGGTGLGAPLAGAPAPSIVTAPYTVLTAETPAAFDARAPMDGVRVTFAGAVQPGGVFAGSPEAAGQVALAPTAAALARDVAGYTAPGSLAWNRFALDFAASAAVAGATGR